jgi:GTP pyrophosphokinase
VVALGNPYATGAAAADGDEERVDPTRPGWLARLLDWQRSAPDPDAFWSGLRAELAQDREITVFRVDGGRLGLPAGATCIDAAYAQYGETAHGCIGARVNGRLASLGTRLSDGDTVQPLLAQDASSGPAAEWLEHAKTQAARIAISSWLRDHPDGATPTTTPARAPLSVVGARGGGGNAVADLPDATVRLAGCCTPVPPDEVAGFVVRGGAVTVHRVACAAVAQMRSLGRTSVAVHWRATADCRVTLTAESFGRPHLLADLTEAIARQGVEVVSATVEPPVEQRVRHTYTLQLPDASVLPALMRAMRDVPGVYDVDRA